MGFINLSRLGPAEVAHGWMFIGLDINILLLGIMIIQTYLYYSHYKNDGLWLKLFVGFLLVADIFNTVFGAAYLYESLIVNFSKVNALGKATWILASTTAVVVLSVQLFFAWRVYALTQTRIWSFFIVAFALTAAVGGITMSVDVVRCKHKSGVDRSDQIVDKLIRFSVQTGLITFIFASLHLAFFLSDESGLHLLFNFPICKLYSNFLLSSLNSRFASKSGIEAQNLTMKTTESVNFEHQSSLSIDICGHEEPQVFETENNDDGLRER
ncbi:hypothetical protein CPB83DRAFT_893183 [Crepidotus variabilis]|uniref:DUF6534 domain-containing protein n=1 Tax=Crepidotus variabilis TaxID=179855 RepID=A0A9P6EJD8_9AGAR|nr:hypothetical protein CPB83DRAFT_893183 [Crepidotus variabilis]